VGFFSIARLTLPHENSYSSSQITLKKFTSVKCAFVAFQYVLIHPTASTIVITSAPMINELCGSIRGGGAEARWDQARVGSRPKEMSLAPARPT
jgi:hypothetical protein